MKNIDLDLLHSQWNKALDSYTGSDTIKSKTTEYLPYTRGMLIDVLSGDIQKIAIAKGDYEHYLNRAVYYNYLKSTIDSAVGIINVDGFQTMKIPDYIDVDNITIQGEDIRTLNINLNYDQMITGRTGLLVNPNSDGGFKLVQYSDFSIVDYRYIIEDGKQILTDLVLNDETGFIYFALDDNGYCFSVILEEYSSIDDIEYETDEIVYPALNGNYINEIPFVFINAYDLKPDPSQPPLIDLVDICLHIYKCSADLQTYIYLSGQSTLFLVGFSEEDIGEILKLGSGTMLATNNENAKAQYLSIDGNSIPNMMKNLDNLHKTALNYSINVVQSGQAESGIAIENKVLVKSSNIRFIAKVSAEGIKRALDIAVKWSGKNDTIELEAVKSFTTVEISIENLIRLLDANVLSNEQVQNYIDKTTKEIEF